jgi:hypothetical protein
MTGPTSQAMRRLRCRSEFGAVWSILDERARALLLAVVLRNISIGRTAELLDVPKPRLTQALVAVLDRLCQHWDIRQGSERPAA